MKAAVINERRKDSALKKYLAHPNWGGGGGVNKNLLYVFCLLCCLTFQFRIVLVFIMVD